MIKNYLKIAYRNLLRHKGYSIINIAGLAVGIAACLLIFVIVKHELSYDTHNKNRKNIYRIVTKVLFKDGTDYDAGVPGPFLKAFKNDIPVAKETAELYANYGSQITVLEPGKSAASDKKFYEETGVFFTSPDFYKIFDSKWLAGDPSSLAQPNTVAIDKSHAEKYFGDWKNAMGQSLKMDNTLNLRVTGVLEDAPVNTDLPMRVIASFETLTQPSTTASGLYPFVPNEWGASTTSHQIYLLLPGNVDPTSIDNQLVAFRKKYIKQTAPNDKILTLQPLRDIHFDLQHQNLGDHVTSKSILWTLSLIGVFILIMASINFINLSTAQAVGRSKEVGIRKVLGSKRAQLVWQIMGETFLLVLVSAIIGLLIAMLALPYLHYVSNIPEGVPLFTLATFSLLLIIIVTITLVTGIYPALVLSGFTPALALKNKITSASVGGISLRRALVVLQFSISQALIIGTVVAVSQMNFIHKADLGFNKEAVMMLPNITDSTNLLQMTTLKQKLEQIPAVQSVSFSSDPPATDNNWTTNFYFNNSNEELGFNTSIKQGDINYFKTYGLRFLAGRGYQESDTIKEVVINETLMKKLGVQDPKEAIGKTIKLGGRGIWAPIVGVVKDYTTNSMRDAVNPMVMMTRKQYYTTIGIKLQTKELSQTLSSIKDVWEKAFPEHVYKATFLDEDIERFYKQENQLELAYKVFASIAIFISCLGLYGLVSFMAVQKTKEIGIRKVLGASVSSIVYLFSKEFTILILIAFALAVPVAYVMMKNWLQNFAFRIPLSVSVFAIAIITSIAIAWITVGYKAIKAAFANPVKSLRTE